MEADSTKKEPTNRPSQVTLGQMLKSLDKDVAVNVEKKLNKLVKKRAIRAPLEKHKAEQAERKIAYSLVSKEVSRWEPIVDKNRKAKQLRFPLDQEQNSLPSTSEALGQLNPCNDFEQEVKSVIASSETVLHDKREFSKAEEKYLKAISVEEAEERHRELQKKRVLLSSYAAKMRRQKAIKSKSYRRLLKHERIKRHVKNVESDKDLLVEEIERLQRLRAQERASLKHKTTGKWAKHAKFRSKYDEEARKAMLEQIGIAEKLLEKPVIDEDSDDSTGQDSEEDAVSVSAESDNEGEPEKETTLKEEVSTDDRLVVSSELIEGRASRKRKTSAESYSDEEMDGEDDDSEDDDQRRLMSEAFADDDVVAEFKKAKNKMADEEQPKDIDLFLPGWNDWAGPGIKTNKNKRKKYIVKAKKLPRRDETLGNVMISEQASSKSGLLSKMLPKNSNKLERVEKMLMKPITGTFVSQSEHREAIKPRIETKMGARIEPLSKTALRVNKAKWA